MIRLVYFFQLVKLIKTNNEIRRKLSALRTPHSGQSNWHLFVYLHSRCQTDVPEWTRVSFFLTDIPRAAQNCDNVERSVFGFYEKRSLNFDF